MKKLISLILFVSLIGFLLTPAYAQVYEKIKKEAGVAASSVKNGIIKVDTSSTTKMLYGDLKNATSTIYQDAKSVVSAVAKSLGVGAEHVYVVLTRQYLIQGAVNLILSLFALFVLYKILYWLMLNISDDKYYLIVPIVACIAVAVSVLTKLPEYATQLFNPEYYTLKFIIEQIKNLK